MLLTYFCLLVGVSYFCVICAFAHMNAYEDTSQIRTLACVFKFWFITSLLGVWVRYHMDLGNRLPILFGLENSVILLTVFFFMKEMNL